MIHLLNRGVKRAAELVTEPLAFFASWQATAAARNAELDPDPTEEDLVEAALNQLRSWIAQNAGEKYGNNRGPWVEMWAQRKSANWCAAVIASAFDHAASGLGMSLPFSTEGRNRLGAKRLVTNIGKAGSFVDRVHGDLRPGDVISYHRGPPKSWKGHVRIVESYDKHTRVITYLAGNEGDFPSLLRRGKIPRDRSDMVAIARL